MLTQGLQALASNTIDDRYKIDKKIVSHDLTADRPLYILSAYGPGKDAPEQLFGGQPREQSFEELRFRHYELAVAGNEAQAIQEAQLLYTNAEKQIQTALSDLDGAIKYINDAANHHPNRLDVCGATGHRSTPMQQLSDNPQTRNAAFGGDSGFMKPAFGQATKPASAFGQTSFGQAAAPTPAFGQLSASAPSFGQPAFGQPSAPTSAFGQPAFGQNAAPTPAFGQPASLSQNASIFGQSSNSTSAPAFGQTSTPSPFGQAQQTANPLVQQLSQQPAPGLQNNGFGQGYATGSQTAGPFGQQQSVATSNAFTNPARPPLAFGQSSMMPDNPAAQPTALQPSSVFGQNSTPQLSSTFGHASDSQPANNLFGTADSARDTSRSQPTASAFGQPTAQLPAAKLGMSAQNVMPAAQPSLTTSKRVSTVMRTFSPGNPGTRKLLSWDGQKVTYIDDEPYIKNAGDGGWQRIWFPEGPPTFTEKTQEYPEGYAPDAAARGNIEFFLQHGVGPNGLIPDMPPPRDMISWNF
ncbi:MAG: hypothetical protein LQ352_002904 [Teloschistes flavicans]|nr:MAG: hypothetical protein LQ352_002904 [Teloschistes flavicans]